MVIFGGLEIVAAGYVLNEIHKDDKKAQAENEKARRRRQRREGSQGQHHHHHHQHGSGSRPPRPAQEYLVPPGMGPPRPNSAPPPQSFQHPPQHQPGPWMNRPGQPQPQHQQLPFRPPNPQTWPQAPRPQIQRPSPNNAGAMFRPQDFPPNPHATPPPPYQQHPPPPTPGALQHSSTMHFDTKTGKWQSDMLPPDMPRANSMPVSGSRARSSSVQPPPSRLREGSRAYSRDSLSSSDDDNSDSDHEHLAYGSLPGRRVDKVLSHERVRPQQLSTHPTRVELPVEGDWYAKTPQQQQQLPYRGASVPPPAHGSMGGRLGTQMAPAELEHRVRYELP